VVDQSFDEHTADVLAIATNDDYVFSTGIDTKVEIFRREGTTTRNAWVASYGVRANIHDLRAMVVTKHDVLIFAGNIYSYYAKLALR
jgi:hypothetical protein